MDLQRKSGQAGKPGRSSRLEGCSWVYGCPVCCPPHVPIPPQPTWSSARFPINYHIPVSCPVSPVTLKPLTWMGPTTPVHRTKLKIPEPSSKMLPLGPCTELHQNNRCLLRDRDRARRSPWEPLGPGQTLSFIV